MNESNPNLAVERRPGIADIAASTGSAVSWGAVLAGGTATAAFSLALLVLGTGLGLATVSPWVNSGVSAMTFGVSAILWITFTQLVSSGLGGYLAGRLRAKWIGTHTDEVHFRDTAHGFLSWAVAALVHAAVLTSVIATVIAGGVAASTSVAQGVATGAAAGAAASSKDESPTDEGPMAYFVDSLFRRDAYATAQVPSGVVPPPAMVPPGTTTAEVSRILVFNGTNESLPADDVRYIGQLVAQRTGLSQGDAEKRVTDTYAKLQTKVKETEFEVKTAADKARKASSYAALWLFISWLTGAFVSSLSATFGGRQRDL